MRAIGCLGSPRSKSTLVLSSSSLLTFFFFFFFFFFVSCSYSLFTVNLIGCELAVRCTLRRPGFILRWLLLCWRLAQMPTSRMKQVRIS